MDYEQIALAFHLLGFALGLGGATISDITFLRILKSRKLTSDHYSFLHSLSMVIWVGLGLLIFSGLVMFSMTYSAQGSIPMLLSSRWQTKLTLVGIVLANGLFFKYGIFPRLKALIGQELSLTNILPLKGRLAFSGTISIVSWYGIFIVTQLPRTFRPSYFYFMGVYLIIVFVGALISSGVIRRIVS